MITELAQVTEGRLCWPDSVKQRAPHVDNHPFKQPQVDREENRIKREMELWRVRDYVVSRNRQRIYAGDPAVALWWLDQKGELRVLACDRYASMAENMHAIVLTLEALRGVERWGAYTAEQAAEGTRLLMIEDRTKPRWWSVLGVGADWPLEAIENTYKLKAQSEHPDKGGDPEKFAALNAALDEARKAKGNTA